MPELSWGVAVGICGTVSVLHVAAVSSSWSFETKLLFICILVQICSWSSGFLLSPVTHRHYRTVWVPVLSGRAGQPFSGEKAGAHVGGMELALREESSNSSTVLRVVRKRFLRVRTVGWMWCSFCLSLGKIYFHFSLFFVCLPPPVHPFLPLTLLFGYLSD